MECPKQEFTDQAREAAHKALRQLAIKVQGLVEARQFPADLLSFNLHMLVCRLHEQEGARGHLAYEAELFIERGVGELKASTRQRSSSEPERVAVNSYLIDMALARDKHMHGLKTVAEMMAEEAVTLDGDDRVPDDLFDTAGAELLGCPLRCRGGGWLSESDKEQVDVFLASDEAESFVCSKDASGAHLTISIERDNIDWEAVRVYGVANKRNDEIISSDVHHAPKNKRANNWVKIRWDGVGTFIGHVKKFLRVPGEHDSVPFVVRLAVCELWKFKFFLSF